MREQINDTAGLAALEAARPLGWQAAAIGEYEQSWTLRQADLRAILSARIAALTGQRISPQEVYTDGHLAVAGVDGTTFRLYHGGDLVLVRGCTYCGTDRFESPKIGSLLDLGYALSAWRPLHEDCEHYPPEVFPDF
jgi:hypothetical protein